MNRRMAETMWKRMMKASITNMTVRSQEQQRGICRQKNKNILPWDQMFLCTEGVDYSFNIKQKMWSDWLRKWNLAVNIKWNVFLFRQLYTFTGMWAPCSFPLCFLKIRKMNQKECAWLKYRSNATMSNVYLIYTFTKISLDFVSYCRRMVWALCLLW